jgi:hypothetical protein
VLALPRVHDQPPVCAVSSRVTVLREHPIGIVGRSKLRRLQTFVCP